MNITPLFHTYYSLLVLLLFPTQTTIKLQTQPTNIAFPPRFTTRGKVALAFSILSGILGVLVVAIYGVSADPAAAPQPTAQGTAGEAAPSVGDSSSANAEGGPEPKGSRVLVVSESGQRGVN